MKQRKEYILGLFVFAAITSLIAFLFLFDKLDIGSKTYSLRVRFNDVTSLEKGVPVLLGGVKIGKVVGIFYEDNSAVVEVEIKNSIKISREARITISLKGVVGDLVVNIYNPYEFEEYFLDGETANGEDPISLNAVMEDMYDALSSLGVIGEQLTSFSDQDLKKTINSINNLAETMNITLESTNALLEENRFNVNRTLKNAGLALNTANKLMEENRESLNSLLSNTDKLIVRIDALVENRENDVRDIMYGMIELISESRLLISDNADKIEEVMNNLEDASKRILKLVSELNPEDLANIKLDIEKIVDDSKVVVEKAKTSLTGESSQRLKGSIDNVEEITNKLKSLVNNQLSAEVEVITGEDNKTNLNLGFTLYNAQRNIYMKLNKLNVTSDFDNLNITFGRRYYNNIFGFGVIDSKPGVEYKYEFNEYFEFGFTMSDFKQENVMVNTDFIYQKFKINLKYNLSDKYFWGIGYRF